MVKWIQHGDRLDCVCSLGRFSATMPQGWRLEDCHPSALAVAAYLLLHNIPAAANDALSLDDVLNLDHRPGGSSTLLCYSAGADSTAALELLPDLIPVFCRRSYEHYVFNGRKIDLAPIDAIERCFEKIGNVVQVPNNFETIGLHAGFRHGFRDGFGYGVMACLLADHLDASAVAFGSVLDNVFLGSGDNYTDIVAYQSSAWHTYSKLFAVAGLHHLLPTGGLSEVITEKIARESKLAGYIVSCPLADGVPCGTCFKCFRKLRLAGLPAPEPTGGALKLLAARPVKQASTTVYACQQSGDWPAGLDEYRDVQLDFLSRYHSYGVSSLLPPHIAEQVRGKLNDLEIAPMSREDEGRLRNIGQAFNPAAFNRTRAGLPVERLDSQSLA